MKQDQVLQDVQLIEQLGENLKENQTNQKLKQELQQKILNLCFLITQQPETDDYLFISEVIDLLLMFNQKYDFDSLFQSCIDFKLILLYSKALHQQNCWKLSELITCLQQLEDLFQTIFLNKIPDLFRIEHQFKKGIGVYYSTDVFHLIQYSLIVGETYMQHTAVLSQMKKNQLALNKVIKCFEFFKNVFYSLKKMMEAILSIGVDNIEKKTFKNEQSLLDLYDYICYLDTIELPSIDDSSHDVNSFLSEHQLYQRLQKDFNQNSIKNKFESVEIIEQHISNIVKLGTIEQLVENLATKSINENVIVKLIQIFSCCIFSIAAENRFISHYEINEKNQENKQLNASEKILENYSKDLLLQQHKRIMISEKIHLKAIEVLYFGISTESKLFQHFLESYKKNYNFSLHMIQEVEEPSITTIKQSEYYAQGFLKSVMGNNPELQKHFDKMMKERKKKDIQQIQKQINFSKSRNHIQMKNPISTSKKLSEKHLEPFIQKQIVKRNFRKKNQTVNNRSFNDSIKLRKQVHVKSFINEKSVSQEKGVIQSLKNDKQKNLSVGKSPRKLSNLLQSWHNRKGIKTQTISNQFIKKIIKSCFCFNFIFSQQYLFYSELYYNNKAFFLKEVLV